jgi:DNA-binding FadR family transcriptional regulator
MHPMTAAISRPSIACGSDLQFHAAIARASHHTVLGCFISGMRSLLELWINKAVTRRKTVAENVQEHNAILRAVIERDPERAAPMIPHLADAADRFFAVEGCDHSTTKYISLLLNGESE